MTNNNEDMRTNVEVSMERREIETIQKDHYKKQTKSHYNQCAKGISFKKSEQVLRNNEASRQEPQGKLRPIWEAPYKIQEANRDGSYILQIMEGETVPRSLHVKNLRNFYV